MNKFSNYNLIQASFLSFWFILSLLLILSILYSAVTGNMEVRNYDKFLVGFLVGISLIYLFLKSHTEKTKTSERQQIIKSFGWSFFSNKFRVTWFSLLLVSLICLLLYFFGKPSLHFTPQYAKYVKSVPSIFQIVDEVYINTRLAESEIQELAQQYSSSSYIISDKQELSGRFSEYQAMDLEVMQSDGWKRNPNGLWVTERERYQVSDLIFSIKPKVSGNFNLMFEIEKLALGSPVRISLNQEGDTNTNLWFQELDNLDCIPNSDPDLDCLPERILVKSPLLNLSSEKSYTLNIIPIGNYQTRTLPGDQTIGGYIRLTDPRIINIVTEPLSRALVTLLNQSSGNFKMQISEFDGDQIALIMHQPFSKSWNLRGTGSSISNIHTQLNYDTNLWLINLSQDDLQKREIQIVINHQWWELLLKTSQVTALLFLAFLILDIKSLISEVFISGKKT